MANGDLAEAVAVNPKEVLINGKMPGETSLIVWQQNGSRLIYDLTVRMSNVKLEAVRQQIARDFPDRRHKRDVRERHGFRPRHSAGPDGRRSGDDDGDDFGQRP